MFKMEADLLVSFKLQQQPKTVTTKQETTRGYRIGDKIGELVKDSTRGGVKPLQEKAPTAKLIATQDSCQSS